MTSTISHAVAVAPFCVAISGAVIGSHDEVIGTRTSVEVAGLMTVGWALVLANKLNESRGDIDTHFEVYDARGRRVFCDSRFDLRGRRKPVPVRPVDDLPF